MTTSELVAAIDQIKKDRLEDIKGRISSLQNNSSFYVVVDNQDVVTTPSSISFIYEGNFKYAILIVSYGYLTNFWYKDGWEFAAFLTPNSILTAIPGEHWSIIHINFGFTPQGSTAPSLKFRNNLHPEQTITYDVKSNQFDLAWKFFLEINSVSLSFEESTYYIKYYNEKLSRQTHELSLENYKKEIAKRDSLINEYKDLLNLIGERLSTNE